MTSRARRCCCSRHLHLKKIGQGGSATVYLLVYKDGVVMDLVLKLFRKAKDCLAEYDVLRILEHKNIIKCVGKPRRFEGKNFLLLEKMEKGSLQSLYDSRELEEDEIKGYILQLVKAVHYLHVRDIVHRDIKCANCLIGKGNDLKLADFATAAKLGGGQATTTGVLKSDGTAPEASQSGSVFGKPADMYSVGYTMLKLFWRGRPPSPIHSTERSPEIQFPPTISEAAKEVIRMCLQWNPAQRPTAAQLLEHEYFRGIGEDARDGTDDGSSGLFVFNNSQAPSFITEDYYPAIDREHTPSCCMNKAWEWRDHQGMICSQAELDRVQDIFGKARSNGRHRECSSLCSFLHLMPA